MAIVDLSYMQEFSVFDDMYDYLEKVTNDISEASDKYEIVRHQLEMKRFFESADDYDVLLEKEGEGILAKIGNAILGLAEKIGNLVNKMFGKAQEETVDQLRKDEEIVSQMIRDNPELKDQILKGLNEEWFTCRDIAQFEKDTISLIKMLDANTIDHQTFLDKFKAKCKAFNDSAAPIVGSMATITAFFKFIPDMNKNCVETKKTFGNIRKTCQEFGERVKTNYAEKDVNKAQAIMNALTNAIGLSSKECEQRVQAQKGICGLLNKIAGSPVGKLLKADENSRKARHDAARDKLTKERNDKLMKAVENNLRSYDNKKKRISCQDMIKEIQNKYPNQYNDTNITRAYYAAIKAQNNP